ncbi:hypothetical protein I3F58_01890 [Streptomyces sp. MUM 203J]|nr:hypothetical protein [Streptomyces sp. MUM 203J]
MVVVRVLFAVLPLLSLGFLTGASMLRLAVVTRRTLDWWLFGVSVAATLGFLLLTGPDPEALRSSLGAGGVLLNAALFTGYFLYADIRHHERAARSAVPTPAPYHQPRPQSGYGYPQPNPYQQQPQQAARQPTPPPASPPASPFPAPRIDQVRAELDELSDLLRKDEGGTR